MNRRQFLHTASLLAANPFPEVSENVRFVTGLVPAGKTTIETGVRDFWTRCDEVSEAGAHQMEFNNTRARIAEAYVGRVAEFREGMAERRMNLPGLAQFSHMGNSEETPTLLQQHLLLGKFLSSVGGKYITHMIAPAEVLNETDAESAYRRIDLKSWAKNANEVGRHVYEQWGIKLAYHPEQREVSLGFYQRFLEATDPQHVHFIADVGHLAAGGADPVQVCRRYRDRLVAVHLKDFTPSPAAGVAAKAGNVPFGRGVVDLPGVVAELRRSHFAGWVMGESGGSDLGMCAYLSQTLGLKL